MSFSQWRRFPATLRLRLSKVPSSSSSTTTTSSSSSCPTPLITSSTLSSSTSISTSTSTSTSTASRTSSSSSSSSARCFLSISARTTRTAAGAAAGPVGRNSNSASGSGVPVAEFEGFLARTGRNSKGGFLQGARRRYGTLGSHRLTKQRAGQSLNGRWRQLPHSGPGVGIGATLGNDGAGCAPSLLFHVQKARFHEFFGNGGAMGGGGGDTELYDELGVGKDASDKDIKTAFRKLAMKHHPDQGGDTEKFTKIQEAYEVLSDPEKRQQYDQFGKAAVDGSMGNGEGAAGFQDFDVNDVFSQFFGGGAGGPRTSRGPTRTEDMVYNLSLDLESLYNGTTKKISVNRNSLCGTCDGLGAASASDITTCPTCGGRGVVITTRQFGPMMQRVQQPCTACGGEGKIITPGKQCSTCSGQKIVRERKTFDVNVKPGTMPNKRLVLRGESNQAPGATPGDVVLIINEKPHPTFKRQGNDLVYEHSLKLVDALAGFAFPLDFLDGTTMLLQNNRDDPPIGSRTVNKVVGKGMRSGSSAGDLYVVWDVEMPEDPLTDEQKGQIRELLGDAADESPEAIAEKYSDADKVELRPMSARDRRRHQNSSRNSGANSEEEGEGTGCKQM